MKEETIMETVSQTNIAGLEPSRGKVRDIYDLGGKLLIVATDRISAFDVVMANGIPYKGIVLTQISRFWFDFLSGQVEHHLISDDVKTFPEPFCKHPEQLARRSMLVKKGEVLPVECVVRGYLERVPAERNGLRAEAAVRSETVRKVAGIDIHTGHQGRTRNTR